MRSIKRFISTIFMIEFIFCLVTIVYFPDKVAKITGYRLYTVMTDSMEPTIPTYSLVLTKLIPEDVEICLLYTSHNFYEDGLGAVISSS